VSQVHIKVFSQFLQNIQICEIFLYPKFNEFQSLTSQKNGETTFRYASLLPPLSHEHHLPNKLVTNFTTN
jgi:hypothetical protein